MRIARPKSRVSGFTLLELLVVIGIIGVLLSLLFPVAGRLNDRVKSLTCASNERLLFFASMSYVAANDGYLPNPSSVGNTPATNGASVTWAMDSVSVADFQIGTLWPYMPESLDARAQAMLCPSDINETSRGAGSAQGNQRNFSYSMNRQIYGSSVQKLLQVARPAIRVIIYEEFGPNDGVCYGPSDSDDWLSGRHGGTNSTQSMGAASYYINSWRQIGRGNVCYFDGHIELMTVEHYFSDPSHYSPLNQ